MGEMAFHCHGPGCAWALASIQKSDAFDKIRKHLRHQKIIVVQSCLSNTVYLKFAVFTSTDFGL